MWVLLEQVQTKKDDRPIYFKRWSEYEPVTTDDLQEAHRFDSKEAAKVSAAYRHRNSSFVPIEVEVKSKAAA